MIVSRRAITSSPDQLNFNAFCDISKPEVATPPAFTALPGPNGIRALMNAWIASAWQPMLETSATYFTPFAIRAFASSALNSFCVAQGIAMSTFTSQGFLPAMNLEPGNFFS